MYSIRLAILVIYGKKGKHWIPWKRYRGEWRLWLWIHSDKPMWAVKNPNVGDVYKVNVKGDEL